MSKTKRQITNKKSANLLEKSSRINNTAKIMKDPEKDEYYLASMFPNDDVMHRVYSIIRTLEQA